MKSPHDGFKLLQSREVKEIKATAYIYEHLKTGAQIMHLANDDNNKVFCATFMTLPEDSTGCPHILEHSVLNGSKNFPAKSTFNELLKGSLHTFINAMTASDMTLYPVASTNDKDFYNLMRVYLDAVFFPKIYTDPLILQQEGWHYELSDPEAELGIRGVVYNEMKGAFSSPNRLIASLNQHFQFPDNTYGFESGGDPDVIPELSYEKFIAFHQKYYHPTNCKIMLYGDLDLQAAFTLLDEEYLGTFSKAEPVPPLREQTAFPAPKRITRDYPIDEGQDKDGAYYLCMNYTFGRITDLNSAMATSLLADLLLNGTASPLKKAILKSGLAGDAYCSADTDLLQPTLSLTFKNVRQEDLAKLEELVMQELKRLVSEGFDKKLIEASISHREFYMREAQMNYPKGLYYHFLSAGSWIHGGDPIDVLAFEPILEEMKRGISEPYFEEHLRKVILDNPHASIVTYVPNPGMVKAQDEALKAKLKTYKDSLSREEIETIIANTAKLAEYHATEDKPEDLSKIPSLSLKDLTRTAPSYPRELEFNRDHLLMTHPLATNGIAYVRAYFDLSHASESDLPWLQLYTWLVGEIDSENYGFAELSNETDIHTGGINLQLSMLCDYNDPDIIHRNYILYGKAVQAKLPRLFELMTELGLKPSFADHERIKSLIKMYVTRMESYMMRNGVTVAITRMLKPFSQLHRWNDLIMGLEFYHFLKDLEKDLDRRLPELIKNMEAIKRGYFTRQNLKLSVTSDPEMIPEVKAILPGFIGGIADLKLDAVEEHFTSREINEAITAPVKIQFVAKGGNFFRKGYPYSGKLRVLTNILSNDFLHKEIRVKGGAYGFMGAFSTSGFQYFVSYMDPNLKETLEAYDKVPDYLRSFNASERDMEKYIIGEMSSLDYPISPERKGIASDEDYITGFTQEDKQQIRDEVLSTKVEDIRAFADMVEALMQKDHYAVFGNEQKIRENADLFDVITPVFK